MSIRTFLKHSYLLICLVLVMSSCGEPSHTYEFPANSGSDEVELLKVGVKRIALDSTLGIVNQSIVYYEDPEPRISILNSASRKLHIFQYSTGEQIKVIPLEYEGENGLGNLSNMGHYMQTEDSIFLTNHWENRLYLINGEGKVVSKYQLKDDTGLPSFYLMNNSISRMKLYDKDLYISLQSTYDPKLESRYMLKLNLQDSSVNYYFDEPRFLTDHFWGPMTPYQFSIAFAKDRLVTSFGKNPEVDVYSLNNLEKVEMSKVIGSKHVRSFESFPKKNSKATLFGHRYQQIAPLTNQKAVFTAIDFDPVSNGFIRTMLLPRTQEQYEMRAGGMELTYILTDENLNVIGETKMPRGKYAFNSYFLNDKGMHIVNREEYAKNENELTFDIYAIEPKE